MKTTFALLFSTILLSTSAFAQPKKSLLGDQWGDPLKLVENSNLSSQTKAEFKKARFASFTAPITII